MTALEQHFIDTGHTGGVEKIRWGIGYVTFCPGCDVDPDHESVVNDLTRQIFGRTGLPRQQPA